MTGIEKMEYILKKIIFPHFYIHPDFAEFRKDFLLNKSEIGWTVICDFKVANIKDGWYDLIINIILTMNRKTDGVKISELKTETTFHTVSEISFELKYKFLCWAINQTVGHAQGGWHVKNRNVVINSILPQAYDKVNEEEQTLKKKLYEIWE